MKIRVLAVVLLLAGCALAQTSRTAAPAVTDPAAQTPAAAQPKIDPAKEADIRKLMQLTGVENLSGQMMSNMEPSMKATLTQAFPPGDYRAQLIDLFLAKLRGKVSVAIVEAAVPTFDKYFTDEELHQLMAFYETAVGKRPLP